MQALARTGWMRLDTGIDLNASAWTPPAERLLGGPPLGLLARLHRELEPERQRLLLARSRRQESYDAGAVPGYLEGEVTERARSEWTISALPPDLLRRRVEITGPIHSPKMVIQMLGRTEDGHRADAAMLDFEDSMKPSWANVVQGVENLIGAADGSLTFRRPARQGEPEKEYRLDPADRPLLMVRCRGLHLDESNLRVDAAPISGGLMDLALSVHHTARRLLAQGRTPKYYVPKCEDYREARWWNRLFALLEEELSLERGTLRATFLIETLPAAFQMEEILYEVRDRAAGLNVGRWDKIFSDIKCLKAHPDRILADRGSISLNRPWMRDYAVRLIRICHRRGAFAIGGMAAFTPGKTREAREEQARKVLEDKRLENSLGHDGCWVSHPYFIGPALSAFPRDNQLDVIPETDRPDLLPQSTGPRTVEGLRRNVRVGIGYMNGWIQDIGCVAWDDLMEDLATLEISRAQTWQWLRHGVVLDEGPRVTRELVTATFKEEFEKISRELRQETNGRSKESLRTELKRLSAARRRAEQIFLERDFRPFLTCRSDLAGEGAAAAAADLAATAR